MISKLNLCSMKEGWKIVNIGSICNIITGKLDANASSENGIYPFFTCSRESLRIDNYAYDCECVLIAGNGDLNVKYYKGKFNAYQRTYIVTLKNDIKDVSVKYIFKFFEKYVEKLRQLSVGGVIKYIKLGDLTNAKIPVPSLLEQERIVEELDCLSGVIEKKKEQLKELAALAQSIFYEMFGNPFENEKGWGLKRLGDVCEVNPSKKGTSKGLNETDSVSFLPMEDLPIKAGYYQPEKMRILSEVQSSYTCFANNDVLMAKVTPCFENGKIGMVQNLQNGVGYGSSEFIVIRVKDTIVIKEFIYFVIQDSLFIENACAQLTGTSGLRRVPRQYVENCNITIPPLSLQQEFASKIEAIEKQKELIRKSIEEVETLFNSRMDYYFG